MADFAKRKCSWLNGPFTGAGPWPDGQYYVYEKARSGIVNPDTGKCDTPWRKLTSAYAATTAARELNDQVVRSQLSSIGGFTRHWEAEVLRRAERSELARRYANMAMGETP